MVEAAVHLGAAPRPLAFKRRQPHLCAVGVDRRQLQRAAETWRFPGWSQGSRGISRSLQQPDQGACRAVCKRAVLVRPHAPAAAAALDLAQGLLQRVPRGSKQGVSLGNTCGCCTKQSKMGRNLAFMSATALALDAVPLKERTRVSLLHARMHLVSSFSSRTNLRCFRLYNCMAVCSDNSSSVRPCRPTMCGLQYNTGQQLQMMWARDLHFATSGMWQLELQRQFDLQSHKSQLHQATSLQTALLGCILIDCTRCAILDGDGMSGRQHADPIRHRRQASPWHSPQSPRKHCCHTSWSS